jgi:hypothetical protein
MSLPFGAQYGSKGKPTIGGGGGGGGGKTSIPMLLAALPSKVGGTPTCGGGGTSRGFFIGESSPASADIKGDEDQPKVSKHPLEPTTQHNVSIMHVGTPQILHTDKHIDLDPTQEVVVTQTDHSSNFSNHKKSKYA